MYSVVDSAPWQGALSWWGAWRGVLLGGSLEGARGSAFDPVFAVLGDRTSPAPSFPAKSHIDSACNETPAQAV